MTPLARDTNRPISFGADPEPRLPRRAGARRSRLVEQAARRAARASSRRSRCARVGVLIGFGIAINPLVALSRRPASCSASARAAAVARAARSGACAPQLLESVREHSGDILGGMATLEHVFPLTGDGVRGYETTPDRSLVALARAQRGVPPLELMLDLIVAHEGRSFFLVPLFNPDLEAAGDDARSTR